MDIYDAFGFRKGDPFASAKRYDWTGLRKTVRELWRAARERSWTLVYGPPGAGKTVAVRSFVEEYEGRCWIANCTAGHRRMLKVRSLHTAFALDLDLAGLGEKIARDKETRQRQIVRLVGQRAEEKPVLLLLDESSAVDQDLLNDVKHMRDLLWRGRIDKDDERPHFGVGMFGWESLAQRVARVEQNRIRVRQAPMPPMSYAEMDGLLNHVGWTAKKMNEEARRRLWNLAKYPGIARYEIELAMERAVTRGRREVLADDFAGDWDKLQRDIERLSVRQKDIAKHAAVSPAAVSQIMAGRYNGAASTRDRVVRAARDLVADGEQDQVSKKPTRRAAVA